MPVRNQSKTKNFSADKAILATLTLTTLLSGTILASTYVKADNNANNASTAVVDEVRIIIPTACSLAGTIATNNEHTATILPGSYTENIGKTDLTAKCNDFGGFSIYAVGYSDNAGGTPTEGNNTMIGTNTGATINTGTATTGNTSAWAMKLTAITDSSITYNPNNLSIVDNFNNYHNVPNALTKVVQYKNSDSTISSATDQTLGAHVETTYAALVSPTQAADTYTGKVRYLLVHPANFTTGTYSITYNANGGTGTMNSESNIPNYEPHTIPTSTLTPPSGYTLAGWCTVQDQTASGVVQNADPQTTCTGDSYTTTIPASTVANNGTLTLYAYWKELDTHTVTVMLDTSYTSKPSGVTFTHPTYGTQTVNTNGGTVQLVHGETYNLTMITDCSGGGFMVSSGANNAVLNTDLVTGDLTVTGDVTITAMSSREPCSGSATPVVPGPKG